LAQHIEKNGGRAACFISESTVAGVEMNFSTSPSHAVLDNSVNFDISGNFPVT